MLYNSKPRPPPIRVQSRRQNTPQSYKGNSSSQQDDYPPIIQVDQKQPSQPPPAPSCRSYSDVLAGKSTQLAPNSAETSLEAGVKCERKRTDGIKIEVKQETKTKEITEETPKVKPISRNKPTPVGEIDLFSFISTSVARPKGKNNKKPLPVSNAVALDPVPERPNKKEEKKPTNFGNQLDASVPVFHKGKSREHKNKKPTTLKRNILQEREAKEKLSEEDRNALTRNAGPRKFRAYCDNAITDTLNTATVELLTEVKRFQDRLWAKDQDKAKQKRRVVCGLHEVGKHLKLQNVKCLVVAPDLETGQTDGTIDTKVKEMVDQCKQENVTYLFALNRHKLGRTVRKNVCSCVAVLNYQGAEPLYKVMLAEHVLAVEKLKTVTDELSLAEDKPDLDNNDGANNTTSDSNDIPQTSSPDTTDTSNSNGVGDAISTLGYKMPFSVPPPPSQFQYPLPLEWMPPPPFLVPPPPRGFMVPPYHRPLYPFPGQQWRPFLNY